MKRELFIHFSLCLVFFVLISVFKHYLNLSYWPFWLGGVVGTFLPDIDHLVYVFFLSPQELTSQRVNFLLERREVKRTVELLYETRNERKNLVFHSIVFQLIFLALTFFIMTSSTSIFAKGLVLSFALHLSVDQMIDLVEIKNLDNWKRYLPIDLNLRQSQIFASVGTVLVLIMGLAM